MSLQVLMIQRQDFDGGNPQYTVNVSEYAMFHCRTYVGGSACRSVCDNQPGHADCMFLLCQPRHGILLTSASLRWETEKIAGCQICMCGGWSSIS